MNISELQKVIRETSRQEAKDKYTGVLRDEFNRINNAEGFRIESTTASSRGNLPLSIAVRSEPGRTKANTMMFLAHEKPVQIEPSDESTESSRGAVTHRFMVEFPLEATSVTADDISAVKFSVPEIFDLALEFDELSGNLQSQILEGINLSLSEPEIKRLHMQTLFRVA